MSLGVYATIVQQDGYRDAKVETTKALLPEMLGPDRRAVRPPVHRRPTAPRSTARSSSRCRTTPTSLDAFLDATERRSVDTGQLGVIALTATTGKDAAAMVTLAAVGQRKRSRNWHELTAETFEVRSRSGKAFAGVDGEALEMDTPLRFQIYPRGLRLLVPEGNLEIAERRRARDVGFRELFHVAAG